MTSTHTTLPVNLGTSRRPGTDPRLFVAGALFLAVLIAEAMFIAFAAPTIAEIGSLYITVT